MSKKPKARKPSDITQLYRAVQKYVDSRGGKVAVISGCGVLHNPSDKFRFSLQIEITGTKPNYAHK